MGNIIGNLEGRYSEIITSKDVYDELFSLAVYDYIGITQKTGRTLTNLSPLPGRNLTNKNLVGLSRRHFVPPKTPTVS